MLLIIAIVVSSPIWVLVLLVIMTVANICIIIFGSKKGGKKK